MANVADVLHKILMPFLALLIFGACANHPCRAVDVTRLSEANMPASQHDSHVFVYKYDGSKQCGMGVTIPIEDMAKELDGKPIFSRKSQNDGFMRIQVCGAQTGNAHVFEILEKDLASAKLLGFQSWPAVQKH
jgi:hypothetical protein